jgi:hypothetical protein
MRNPLPSRLASLRAAGAAALLALAACQPSTPPPRTTVAPPLPPAAAKPAPAAPTAPALAKAPSVTLPSMALPPGPIYACEVAGRRTVIEFPESVESLCRRHPEMGPCQYERNACRSTGGRVFTTLGEEVTPAVEAAYDEKVRRVRFQADGGSGGAKR